MSVDRVQLGWVSRKLQDLRRRIPSEIMGSSSVAVLECMN